MAQEERLMTKGAARPGDALLLTKPLGTGVTATALKNGKAEASDVSLSVSWMKRLNAEASRIAIEADVRGGTDVTGFGLLGHACEMAAASRSRFRFHLDTIPFLGGAPGYARAGFFPSGSRDNERYFAPQVHFAQEIGGIERSLLFDSQTSGGLLLSVPRHRIRTIAAAADRAGMPIWWIGEVVEGQGVEVTAAAPAGWNRLGGVAEGVVFLAAG
jgi:selenide,water dikinase